MVNTVYRKIKEISAAEMRPRVSIPLTLLFQELNGMPYDSVRLAVTELVDLRLIKYDDTKKMSVKLTLLGSTVKR